MGYRRRMDRALASIGMPTNPRRTRRVAQKFHGHKQATQVGSCPSTPWLSSSRKALWHAAHGTEECEAVTEFTEERKVSKHCVKVLTAHRCDESHGPSCPLYLTEHGFPP